MPTQSGRKAQDSTSQITVEERVACLTWSTSGSSMLSKVILNSLASAADPVAGAHHESELSGGRQRVELGGRPKRGSTVSPKRVIARIRLPVRVSTSSPFACAASAGGPCR